MTWSHRQPETLQVKSYLVTKTFIPRYLNQTCEPSRKKICTPSNITIDSYFITVDERILVDRRTEGRTGPPRLSSRCVSYSPYCSSYVYLLWHTVSSEIKAVFPLAYFSHRFCDTNLKVETLSLQSVAGSQDVQLSGHTSKDTSTLSANSFIGGIQERCLLLSSCVKRAICRIQYV